ncbi:MAG: ASCH domain-containing protein [Candidatus Gracilibacteria bacterium]
MSTKLSTLKTFLSSKDCFTLDDFKSFPAVLHLAVFKEPFLSLIFSGTKTLESRLSKHRSPPYQKVSPGDIILLKESSGPLKGFCTVKNVVYLGPLTTQEMHMTVDQYSKDLCLTEDFKREKKESRYISLFELENITSVHLVSIIKKDPRSWIKITNPSNNAQEIS